MMMTVLIDTDDADNNINDNDNKDYYFDKDVNFYDNSKQGL